MRRAGATKHVTKHGAFGGAGHSSDAMAIWIVQFVGREIRLLDYIEGVGQPLSYYAGELRRRGWKDAIIQLPHDGVATNNITGKRRTPKPRRSLVPQSALQVNQKPG
jgi:phage terminase large subunit